MTTAQDYSLRKEVFTAAWVAIFMAAGISAYSVSKISIMETTGETGSQVSIAYTIRQLFAAMFGIFSGRAADKIGSRIVVYPDGFLYGSGWLMEELTTSVPMFYLFLGAVNGTGSGLIYNSSVAMDLKWYPEKKGVMLGLLPMSVSIGPSLTSRFGGTLCSGLGFGARGLSVIGAAYVVLVWAAGWIMTVPGKDWVAPSTPASVTSTEKVDREYGPFNVLETLRFWMMIVFVYLASMMGIVFVSAFSGITQAQPGVGTAAASWIVGTSTLTNFVGGMGFGRVCDRLGEIKMVLTILMVAILSLFVMRNAFTAPMFIACLIFIGTAFGGVLVCSPPFTQKVFGIENSGVNYGTMLLGYVSGSYFGPQIAAKTKVLGPDRVVMAASYANVYSIAITVGAAGIAVCSLLIYVKSRYTKQTRAAQGRIGDGNNEKK